MRKCRGVGGEVAVMEVSQVVGVRTRARTLALASASPPAAAAERVGSKRRKVAGAAGVVQNSYLQLRSRSLVMTSQRTPANSDGSRARCPSPTPDRLSRCSSNASSEVASVEDPRSPLRSGDPEVTGKRNSEGIELFRVSFDLNSSFHSLLSRLTTSWRPCHVISTAAEKGTSLFPTFPPFHCIFLNFYHLI